MGYTEKPHMEGDVQSTDGRKWVIAGISLRSPLKRICTKTNPAEKQHENGTDDDDDQEEMPTTPTGEQARIPAVLPCPKAPRKRKTSSKCQFKGVREFFTPPDLETVFFRHAERTQEHVN